jgi:hypothetical protein
LSTFSISLLPAKAKRQFYMIKVSGISPHFSPAFYCGDGSEHVYSVALGRAPRHTVEYPAGPSVALAEKLPDAPCIHTRLRRLATKPASKINRLGGLFLCSENILNRNPSESASEFGIAIRNDRLPTATPIPTPNYTIAPSSHFHASQGAPRGACGTGEKCGLSMPPAITLDECSFCQKMEWHPYHQAFIFQCRRRRCSQEPLRGHI